jgi:hypothetical protein
VKGGGVIADGIWQGDPELHAVEMTGVYGRRFFGVCNAAAGGHEAEFTGADERLGAEAVVMDDFAFEQPGHGLQADVGMGRHVHRFFVCEGERAVAVEEAPWSDEAACAAREGAADGQSAEGRDLCGKCFQSHAGLTEKRVEILLVADGGVGAVAGNDDGVFGQHEELGVDGGKNLAVIAAGQVCAADGFLKQGVAGDQLLLGGDPQAEAALGMAGGVENVETSVAEGKGIAFLGVMIDLGAAGGGHAQPCGLHFQLIVESFVVLVHPNGCAGESFHLLRAADVVDVGMGDDDGFHLELMSAQDGENVFDVVSGIDDDGFARGFVAEDGAVALEQADGQNLMNHIGRRLH